MSDTAKRVVWFVLFGGAIAVFVGSCGYAVSIYDVVDPNEDHFDTAQREMAAGTFFVVGAIAAVGLFIASTGFAPKSFIKLTKGPKSKVKCYGCGATRRFDEPCPSCGRPP